MRRLTPPNINALAAFTKIAESKRGDRGKRLKTYKSFLRGRYTVYEGTTEALEKVSKFPFTANDLRPDDIEDCYLGLTSALAEMKVEIRQAQPAELRSLCQYCGIGTPDTYDHYLPRCDFPEFSVLPINLLPCCGVCNGKKPDAVVRGGVRRVINLYFDPIPSEPYMQVEVSRKGDVLVAIYAIAPDPAIPAPTMELVERHFKELGLLRRYTLRAADILPEVRRGAVNHYRVLSSEAVSKYLRAEAQSLRDLYSVNHWRYVLYQRLADRPDLVLI